MNKKQLLVILASSVSTCFAVSNEWCRESDNKVILNENSIYSKEIFDGEMSFEFSTDSSINEYIVIVQSMDFESDPDLRIFKHNSNIDCASVGSSSDFGSDKFVIKSDVGTNYYIHTYCPERDSGCHYKLTVQKIDDSTYSSLKCSTFEDTLSCEHDSIDFTDNFQFFQFYCDDTCLKYVESYDSQMINVEVSVSTLNMLPEVGLNIRRGSPLMDRFIIPSRGWKSSLGALFPFEKDTPLFFDIFSPWGDRDGVDKKNRAKLVVTLKKVPSLLTTELKLEHQENIWLGEIVSERLFAINNINSTNSINVSLWVFDGAGMLICAPMANNEVISHMTSFEEGLKLYRKSTDSAKDHAFIIIQGSGLYNTQITSTNSLTFKSNTFNSMICGVLSSSPRFAGSLTINQSSVLSSYTLIKPSRTAHSFNSKNALFYFPTGASSYDWSTPAFEVQLFKENDSKFDFEANKIIICVRKCGETNEPFSGCNDRYNNNEGKGEGETPALQCKNGSKAGIPLVNSKHVSALSVYLPEWEANSWYVIDVLNTKEEALSMTLSRRGAKRGAHHDDTMSLLIESLPSLSSIRPLQNKASHLFILPISSATSKKEKKFKVEVLNVVDASSSDSNTLSLNYDIFHVLHLSSSLAAPSPIPSPSVKSLCSSIKENCNKDILLDDDLLQTARADDTFLLVNVSTPILINSQSFIDFTVRITFANSEGNVHNDFKSLYVLSDNVPVSLTLSAIETISSLLFPSPPFDAFNTQVQVLPINASLPKRCKLMLHATQVIDVSKPLPDPSTASIKWPKDNRRSLSVWLHENDPDLRPSQPVLVKVEVSCPASYTIDKPISVSVLATHDPSRLFTQPGEPRHVLVPGSGRRQFRVTLLDRKHDVTINSRALYGTTKMSASPLSSQSSALSPFVAIGTQSGIQTLTVDAKHTSIDSACPPLSPSTSQLLPLTKGGVSINHNACPFFITLEADPNSALSSVLLEVSFSSGAVKRIELDELVDGTVSAGGSVGYFVFFVLGSEEKSTPDVIFTMGVMKELNMLVKIIDPKILTDAEDMLEEITVSKADKAFPFSQFDPFYPISGEHLWALGLSAGCKPTQKCGIHFEVHHPLRSPSSTATTNLVDSTAPPINTRELLPRHFYFRVKTKANEGGYTLTDPDEALIVPVTSNQLVTMTIPSNSTSSAPITSFVIKLEASTATCAPRVTLTNKNGLELANINSVYFEVITLTPETAGWTPGELKLKLSSYNPECTLAVSYSFGYHREKTPSAPKPDGKDVSSNTAVVVDVNQPYGTSSFRAPPDSVSLSIGASVDVARKVGSLETSVAADNSARTLLHIDIGAFMRANPQFHPSTIPAHTSTSNNTNNNNDADDDSDDDSDENNNNNDEWSSPTTITDTKQHNSTNPPHVISIFVLPTFGMSLDSFYTADSSPSIPSRTSFKGTLTEAENGSGLHLTVHPLVECPTFNLYNLATECHVLVLVLPDSDVISARVPSISYTALAILDVETSSADVPLVLRANAAVGLRKMTRIIRPDSHFGLHAIIAAPSRSAKTKITITSKDLNLVTRVAWSNVYNSDDLLTRSDMVETWRVPDYLTSSFSLDAASNDEVSAVFEPKRLQRTRSLIFFYVETASNADKPITLSISVEETEAEGWLRLDPTDSAKSIFLEPGASQHIYFEASQLTALVKADGEDPAESLAALIQMEVRANALESFSFTNSMPLGVSICVQTCRNSITSGASSPSDPLFWSTTRFSPSISSSETFPTASSLLCDRRAEIITPSLIGVALQGRQMLNPLPTSASAAEEPCFIRAIVRNHRKQQIEGTIRVMPTSHYFSVPIDIDEDVAVRAPSSVEQKPFVLRVISPSHKLSDSARVYVDICEGSANISILKSMTGQNSVVTVIKDSNSSKLIQLRDLKFIYISPTSIHDVLINVRIESSQKDCLLPRPSDSTRTSKNNQIEWDKMTVLRQSENQGFSDCAHPSLTGRYSLFSDSSAVYRVVFTDEGTSADMKPNWNSQCGVLRAINYGANVDIVPSNVPSFKGLYTRQPLSNGESTSVRATVFFMDMHYEITGLSYTYAPTYVQVSTTLGQKRVKLEDSELAVANDSKKVSSHSAASAKQRQKGGLDVAYGYLIGGFLILTIVYIAYKCAAPKRTTTAYRTVRDVEMSGSQGYVAPSISDPSQILHNSQSNAPYKPIRNI